MELKRLAILLCFMFEVNFTVFGQLEGIIIPTTAAPEIDYSSCRGRCDDAYFPGFDCYCNEACDQYENCCYDFYELCRPDYVWSDDWVTFNNHTYKYFADPSVTGDQAARKCHDMGTLLVSINSQTEADFVMSGVLRKRTLSAFIGGSDALKDGTWFFPDGTRMPLPLSDWHLWAEGQPDNKDGEEHCVIASNYKFWQVRKVMMDKYYWLDYPCNSNSAKEIQGYVCEGTDQCETNPCLNGGKCRYVGETGMAVAGQEYTCDCVGNYVGDVCQFEMKEGELWTQCGKTLLTDQSGEIMSPLFPKAYPNNVKCEWTIRATPGNTVALQMETFSVEDGKDCAFDALTIFNGATTNDSILEGPLCGDSGGNSSLLLTSITSSTNEVLVVFTTDHSTRALGFKLRYQQEDCGMGLGDSGCGTKRTFTSKCGSIEVKKGPGKVPCEWLIDVPAAHVINMTFLQFAVQDTGMNCEDGYLAVHDGANGDSPLLGKYCGERFPWQITSSSNQLYLSLLGVDWSDDYIINAEYNALATSSYTQRAPTHMLAGAIGSLSSRQSPINILHKDSMSQKWLIRIPVGDRLELQWSVMLKDNALLEIYQGYSEESDKLIKAVGSNSTQPQNGEVEMMSFQALVVFTKHKDDTESYVEIQFEAHEWNPVLSGCYRPTFYNSPLSRGVENNAVADDEPVMIMVSDKSFANFDAGYDSGLYCKWLVSGKEQAKLIFQFLDSDIKPVSESCDYDGIVVYEGNTTFGQRHGPFCGSLLHTLDPIQSEKSQLVVVFYSDARGSRRNNGILRAMVTTHETSCPINRMETSLVEEIESECGVILSPRLPGLVEPAVYTWTVVAPDWYHYTIYLYYVKGPGIKGDCSQHFSIVEISHDSGKLKQYEGNIVYLCTDTDLFLPATPFRVPAHQKFAVELDTSQASIPQMWEFKLSYSAEPMAKPLHMDIPDGVSCPENFIYYNGHCYRYYPWVLRHYQDEYVWQMKWQESLDHCEKMNATLLSIKDEDEQYFIKYSLNHRPWLWDPAATYQGNHRLIFIGLTNKKGSYQWTDGTPVGYSDWFVPREDWQQHLFMADDRESSAEYININKPQPIADVGSLCGAMALTNPFESTHWIKVPCEYPIFRSGLICKMAATGFENTSQFTPPPNPTDIHLNNYNSPVVVCPNGWQMIKSKCFKLMTNYTLVKEAYAVKKESRNEFSYEAAKLMCSSVGSSLASLDSNVFETIVTFLKIWRHSDFTGNIWLSSEGSSRCSIIKVHKVKELDDTMVYERIEIDCSHQDAIDSRNVLCEALPIEKLELCEANEFECGNSMCITVDSVCDGIDDCLDGSDELNCTCGPEMFECQNGKCIPISLYCDFKDHCGDNSDESSCSLENCGSNQFRCRSGQCIDASAKCNFILDCQDGSDEEEETCVSDCQGLQCYSGVCLHPSLQKDLISDCPGLSLEDETEQKEVKTFFELTEYEENEVNITYHIGCDNNDYVQCRTGNERCFPRDASCIYDTMIVDESRGLEVQTGCRDGSHVRNMCGDIECPGMYHCPGSMCIPYRKLCDGKPDCPGMEDEANCEEYTCPGLFKCKEEHFCIPHSEVCDGTVQCQKHREDEKYCTITEPLCELDCDCTGHVVNCQYSNITALPNATSLQTRTSRALLLAHNKIVLDKDSFANLMWLARLILSHNGIDSIPSGSFASLGNLIELDLSHNKLSSFIPSAFQGLVSLKKLDLSFNLITNIQREVLGHLESISHLIIENNPRLQDIDQDAFEDATSLKTLNADAYKFCCIAEQVEVCTPAGDEFSNCEDLMASYPLQISIWILGLSAFCGNLFVVIWRVLKDRSKVSSFFIINLGISDFLMGVYMLIIGSVDVYYRGNYIIYADSWRASWLCQFAGIISMLSSEVSVFMLTAISLDRAMAILFPLKIGSFRMKHAKIVTMIGWTVCIFLSILPTFGLPYFGDAFFGRTGVCLPFQVSNEMLAGWEYSVFIFLVVNLISFVVIFVSYVLIFLTVKSSMKSMGEKSTAGPDEYALAKKLAIVVATDFLCWVPIILIGFAALGGARIHPQVSAWIAVFILPLNSAINPLLYTISAIDCKKKKKPVNSYATRQSETSMTTLHTKVSRVSTKNGGDNGHDNKAFNNI